MSEKTQDFKKLKLKYEKTKKENRELKDKLNKELRSKEKVEKDILMLCNEKRKIEEKYQLTKGELANMQQTLQEEKKRKKKSKKEQMIYSGIKYLIELVIMSFIMYFIAKREVGQGTCIALIICLAFVALDIVVNAKMNHGENNFIKCYFGLLKDLCQTIFPLLIVFGILYVTKSKYILQFIGENYQMGFVLIIIVAFLLALLVITFVLISLINEIERMKHNKKHQK